MTVRPFLRQLVIHTATKPRPRGILCRACLVAGFAALAHQFQWNWLRFVTSEAILRLSSSMGLSTIRISFDTIRVEGELFQFVTACTFVDVFLGSVPLIWKLGESVTRNMYWVIGAALVLFAFNVARLEVGQILYCRGALSYVWADDVVGGIAYFVVFYVLWRQRRWEHLI